MLQFRKNLLHYFTGGDNRHNIEARSVNYVKRKQDYAFGFGRS